MSSVRVNWPLPGETTSRQVGLPAIGERGHPAVLADEVQRVGQLVGGVQGEQLDALEVALGDPGQGAGGRHLQQPGDAEVGHRRQAEVPAHRRGDLADQPAQHVAAVVDDLAVGVGEQPGPRVVGGDGPGQAGQVGHGRLHVHGVERAGDAERDQPGPGRRVRGQGGELLGRAGGDDLAGAVVVGRRSGPGPSIAASTSSGLPPMTAVIEVGRGGAGRGHRPAPLADEDHRLLGRQHADAGRGGDLADGVAGGDADVGKRVGRVREQLERGEQAGGDQQRLGDRGVADGLGVGLGPVVAQIEAGDGGQPGQPVGEGGLGQPRLRNPGVCAP